MLKGVQFLFFLFFIFLGVQYLNSKPVFSINDISIISSIQYIMRNSEQLVAAPQTQSSCSNFPSHSSLIVRGPSEEEQQEVISRLPHKHSHQGYSNKPQPSFTGQRANIRLHTRKQLDFQA